MSDLSTPDIVDRVAWRPLSSKCGSEELKRLAMSPISTPTPRHALRGQREVLHPTRCATRSARRGSGSSPCRGAN
jgi:hypothetical protein